MNRIVGIVLALCLIAPRAYADISLIPVKRFKVSLVCGHGVDCKRAAKVTQDGFNLIEAQVPVHFQFSSISIIPQDMSGSPEERLEKWRITTEDIRESDQSDMVFVMVDEFPKSLDVIEFEWENVYGIASDIGVLGKYPCISWAKLVGSDKISARVAAHEIGHLLGAMHTTHGLEGQDIRIVQHSDSFAVESVEQMKQHIANLDY